MTNFRETVVGFLVAWIFKDKVIVRQPVNSRNRYIPKGNDLSYF